MKKVIIVIGVIGSILMNTISVNAQGPTWDELYFCDSEEQIQEEIREGEMELLAQLIEAEAGNQDYIGKCLVADVVLNRVARDDFPNTIEDVIYQPYAFSSIDDGNFDEAAWNISSDSFDAAYQEYMNYGQGEYNSEVAYFTAGEYNKHCVPMFKHGDHYFGK